MHSRFVFECCAPLTSTEAGSGFRFYSTTSSHRVRFALLGRWWTRRCCQRYYPDSFLGRFGRAIFFAMFFTSRGLRTNAFLWVRDVVMIFSRLRIAYDRKFPFGMSWAPVVTTAYLMCRNIPNITYGKFVVRVLPK